MACSRAKKRCEATDRPHHALAVPSFESADAGLSRFSETAPTEARTATSNMKTTSRAVLAATAAAASGMIGCSPGVPPTVRAASVERVLCSDVTSMDGDIAVVRDTTVLHVEPTYVVDTCWGTWQVSGARMLMSPPQGVSSEQLARVLQCHGARALLRRYDASMVDDPYWSVDGWVDIDATPTAGRLVVTLHADTVPRNIRLLRRAIAFAKRHGPGEGAR